MEKTKEKKYSTQHEWVSISGEIARIGVSDYIQSMVGDIAFINLPEVGREVKRGECVAFLESVKTAVDVYTPMSGIVRNVNTELYNDPQLVNRNSESEGWLFDLQMTNPQEKFDLLSPSQYEEQKQENKAS